MLSSSSDEDSSSSDDESHADSCLQSMRALPYDSYCRRNLPHPWFVVCLSDKNLSSSLKYQQKLTPHIEATLNPVLCLRSCNREKNVKAGKGSTKKGSGSWELEIVLGPFATEQLARMCQDEWIKRSRKIESRVGHAFIMGQRYACDFIFCRDPRWAMDMFLKLRTQRRTFAQWAQPKRILSSHRRRRCCFRRSHASLDSTRA